MRNRVFLPLCSLVVLVMAFIAAGCSSSRAIQNPVIGIIQVVGHEPFSNLAVNINDKDVYLLECTKEVKAELLKNQQKVYQIIYSEIKESYEGIILVVNKAIPLKTN